MGIQKAAARQIAEVVLSPFRAIVAGQRVLKDFAQDGGVRHFRAPGDGVEAFATLLACADHLFMLKGVAW